MKTKRVQMAAVAEEVKKTMGTEEEPFEGDVPLAKVEQAVIDLVETDLAEGKKFTYVYDSWLHNSLADFLNFQT